MSTYVRGGLANSPLFFVVMMLFTLTLAISVIVVQHQAVFLLVGTLFFILFVSYPVVGVYFTTALLLLSGSHGIVGYVGDSSDLAVTLSKLSGTAALVAWMINVLMKKIPFAVNWVAIWLCAFCGWALMGTALAPDVVKQMPEWVRLVTILGFYLLAINALHTPRAVHIYVVILVLCGFLMSLVAVAQYLFPQLQVSGEKAWSSLGAVDAAFIDTESLQGGPAIRASGRAGHSNWLAFTVLLILPLNLYWYSVVRAKTLKLFIIASVVLQLCALILTFTRTGFLIGVVLAVLMLMKKMVKLTPQRFFGFLVAVALVYMLVLPSSYKERVFTPKQYAKSTSVQSRLQLQESATAYAVENPLFGLGMGGFGFNFIQETNTTALTMKYMVQHQQWNPVFVGTHNMYLEILASTGFPGLIMFICFYVLMVRKLFVLEQEYEQEGDTQGAALASALFISLVGFMLCSVFLHALTQKIWWMIAAAATVLPLYEMSFKGQVVTRFHATTEDPKSLQPVAALPSP
ncbi:MAG: O-antigen ligase family protein [Candidatus Hydrogenedentes bacterium]|nr:O-antigen ligase family protein [Candidatus Hydrogenedentota bacterium]